VVYGVRRRLSQEAGRKVKIGHAGTLDPFATGLLVVLVGRATRIQQYLQHQPKSYTVVARLGWTSDSGDVDGELTETGRVPADPQLPTGELDLAVPSYSAIKVDGQRLYAKARRGEDFEPPVRTMTVYRAQRMALSDDRATFEIDCAGGTYIRSVVGTLEDAYCEELRRTRVGDLLLEDADPETMLDPNGALPHLGERTLTVDEAATMIHGRRFEVDDFPEDAPVRLLLDDHLLGVGRVKDGFMTPETVLAGSVEELLAR
jgi:tRNA pseudouridine55 synthase